MVHTLGGGNQSMTRDPRTDPQPGDLFRRDGKARRVIKRDGDRILVNSGTTRSPGAERLARR